MECANNNGMAKTCKNMTPITLVRALFLTVPGFSFPDTVEFADKAAWNGYIADKSIIVCQGVREVDPQDFEDPIIETTAGEKIPTFDGQRGARYKLLYPLDQHKHARLLSGGNFGLIKGDRNNNLRGTVLEDGTIGGFSLSYFKVNKQERPAADNAPYTSIDIQEEDPDEWDINGLYLTPLWRTSRLDGVLLVVLTAGTIAAGIFTINVNYVDLSNPTALGATNSKAIGGLVDANLRIFDQLGALLTPTTDYTVTPVPGILGEYVVDTNAGTPITGGTAQVVPTATALRESQIEILA